MTKKVYAPAQSGLFRQVAESFSKATGLTLQFQRPGEFYVPEEPQIPPFCRLMARGVKTCERCIETHLALQDPDGREKRTTTCFAGLTSSAVPVRAGDALLGYLHTGHASLDRPARCSQPGIECQLPGRGARKGCAGACRRTPELTKERYEGAIELIELLAGQLAASPDVQLQTVGYPAIDRAVEWLRADVTRNWSLTEIARLAGMHPGYFSEKFHRHVGTTFGKFLATLRVERARHLLEFTSLPVSEVAFASGFRSLSQFNRTFKAHTGRAPSELTRKAK